MITYQAPSFNTTYPEHPAPVNPMDTKEGKKFLADAMVSRVSATSYWLNEFEDYFGAVEDMGLEDFLRGVQLVHSAVASGEISNRYIIKVTEEFAAGDYRADHFDYEMVDLVVQYALFGDVKFA